MTGVRQSHRVDAVLVDYSMPEMDGGKVCAAIKQTNRKALLEACGFTALTASSGREGLAIFNGSSSPSAHRQCRELAFRWS